MACVWLSVLVGSNKFKLDSRVEFLSQGGKTKTKLNTTEKGVDRGTNSWLLCLRKNVMYKASKENIIVQSVNN